MENNIFPFRKVDPVIAPFPGCIIIIAGSEDYAETDEACRYQKYFFHCGIFEFFNLLFGALHFYSNFYFIQPVLIYLQRYKDIIAAYHFFIDLWKLSGDFKHQPCQ